MQRFNTPGIVLARTNYAEADRIITFLTPKYGKVRVMAKGVRKSKSKLAGGIEIFSVSDLLVLPGRGEINTLMSARLSKYYGNIVKDLNRTNAGYEFIKTVNKAIEDDSESGYFDVLNQAFISLNNAKLSTNLIELWFQLHILGLAGHPPNLSTDNSGAKLELNKTYNFNFDTMGFSAAAKGKYSANDIKILRIASGAAHPQIVARVEDADKLVDKSSVLVKSILQTYIQI